MMKKIIMTSVLGVSALALVNANAEVASTATPATKPLHAKKHHHAHAKKNLKSANKTEQAPSNVEDMSETVPAQTISSSSVHHGLPTGLYVGAQVGYGQSSVPNQSFLNNDGLSGRVNIGYQINKNFAVEAGYLALNKKTQVLNDGKNDGKKHVNQQNVMDLAGKVSYPITERVNLYGKAGVAYITSRYDETSNNGTTELNTDYDVARHKFAPEVAVGMDFNVTSNIAVDTSLTHIHPVGNKRPGNINYLAVGVNYTFG
jgi:OmpA-OmpF porin, OOP family